MEYFRVRNWSEFQHYKDRDPPWIKLHFSMLSSTDWVTLDDASRVLAIACMLIASRNHGQVPNDPNYIKRVAYCKKIPKFQPLIDCGFLEAASTLQADASESKRLQAKDTQEERQSRGDQSRAEERRSEDIKKNLKNGKNTVFEKPEFRTRSLKADLGSIIKRVPV